MKKIGTIIILISLIFLVGCTSLSTWVRANLEGVPQWVYEPQLSRNQIAFIGKGSSTMETRARVLAYESVLDQISTYIGEDIVGKYIVELSMRDAIEDYRLKITQEFIKPETESVTVYFLAIADKPILETARTEAEVQLLEKQQQMDRLAAEAAQAFRDNKDVVAAQIYLKIAVIADSLPVNRGKQRYIGAINRIRDIISALRFSVATGDPSIPSTVVTLRRGKRAISPRVSEAPVAVLTEARDGMGRYYQDSQSFVTNESGQLTYTTSNPTLVGKGELVFSLGLTEELGTLRELDPLIYTEFTELLRNKQVPYPYVRDSIIGTQEVVVSISEFDLQGGLLPTTRATETLRKEITKDSIRSVATKRSLVDDDEDYLAALRAMHPFKKYAIVGDAGVSHAKEITAGATVTVTGEISLVNLQTGARLGSTGKVVANAIGDTYGIAEEEAFTKFGTIAIFLLYRFLYR